MYRELIRNKVGQILKGLFTPEDYIIHFGYDCVDIELCHQIYTDTIKELEEFFHNQNTLIYATTVDRRGRIVLMYDVSEFILEEYGSWVCYEKEYGYISYEE